MSKLLVQNFVHVKRKPPNRIHRRIPAQDFEIKSISIKSNNPRERPQLSNQSRDIILEPTPKRIVLIPSGRHRDTKLANVPPSALDLMRKPERLNVEINFPREEVQISP